LSRSIRAAFVLGAVGLLFGLSAAPAMAHEFRNVGKYNFVVGFAVEPAYSGFPNGVELILSDAATEKPVADIGNDLAVEVIFGDQSVPLEIEPKFEVGEFGTVGEYGSDFIPTRPGKYTFHFTGSIKGQDIDESFTSSPDGFAEVGDTVEAEFPVKDPTTGQLSDRIDQEFPRLTADVSDVGDDVDSNKTLTYVALGLGGLALLVSLIAAARGGKKA
jgi:hypothetical protein